MINSVVIDGKKIKISQKDVLGVGGEATVIQHDTWAIKIYHKIDAKRSKKLNDLVNASLNLPPYICFPKKLVYSTQNKIIGFAMSRVPSRHEVMQSLSSKKFRNTNPHCNLKFITDLFIHNRQTIELLHKHKIVIGDNNDLNVMFNTKSPTCVFIDVDSFQYLHHPCMVATESFLDPELYNINLELKPVFQEKHDWYSFWVMFIKSLIMVHPYGGVSTQYRNIPQRALHRLTFFDSSVKYPKSALNPDLLNDNIKSIVERIFGRGERFAPDEEVLIDYRDRLIQCKSCNTFYPSERSNCPQCSTINRQQIQRKVQVVHAPGTRKVTCQEIYSTSGNFVWSKIYDSKIYAIARELNKYVLYTDKTTFELPTQPSKDAKFDLFGGRYLVVSMDSLTDNIDIYDIQRNLLKISNRSCNQFNGRRMFACSKDNLLRIQDEFLFRGNIHPVLQTFTETQVCSIIKDQTWIVASPVDSSVFGFQRFFNNFSFFIIRFENKTEKHTLQLPELDPHESILSISVRFDVSSVLCLMKTEIKGTTYTRVFVFRLSNGELLKDYRVESLSSDLYRNIHGKAFAKPTNTNGIILHATDDGIVQDNIGGNQMLFQETEQFVAEGDGLFQYQKGILVVGDKLVNHLTIV